MNHPSLNLTFKTRQLVDALPLSMHNRVALMFSPDLGFTLDDDDRILSALALSRAGRQWLASHASPVGANYNHLLESDWLNGLCVELDNL